MKKRILSLMLASAMVLSTGIVASASDVSTADATTNNTSTSVISLSVTPKGQPILSATLPMSCSMSIRYNKTAKTYEVITPEASYYKIINNSQPGADSEVKPAIKVASIGIQPYDSTTNKFQIVKAAPSGSSESNTNVEKIQIGLGTADSQDKFEYFGNTSATATTPTKLTTLTAAGGPLSNIENEQPLLLKASVGDAVYDDYAGLTTSEKAFTLSYVIELVDNK